MALPDILLPCRVTYHVKKVFCGVIKDFKDMSLSYFYIRPFKIESVF